MKKKILAFLFLVIPYMGIQAQYSIAIGVNDPFSDANGQNYLSNVDAQATKEAIEAEEGGVAGVYTVKHSLKTNISGNSIMYYVNKAKFSNKTYSFTVAINGKDNTINVKLKAYTGMNETYTNVDASQHSGGTGGK